MLTRDLMTYSTESEARAYVRAYPGMARVHRIAPCVYCVEVLS